VKIGCCVSLGTFVPQVKEESTPSHAERIARFRGVLCHLRDAGYDFVEFPVGMVEESVSDEEYEAIRSLVRDCGIPVAAFNCFIPGRLKIAGPSASLEALRSYVGIALERAARTGASVVVFGSGAARRVPDGWPIDAAEKQIREFIEMAGEAAAANGIKIALEHLNRRETNVGNSLASVTELAREMSLPSIGVLADLYHLDQEGEELAAVRDAGGLLIHTHVADTDRLYPGSGSSDLAGFVRVLREIGYDGGISVECVWSDFIVESVKAASVLKDLLSRSELGAGI
jgi:D-psicose/D-tagatose/L-ribulose 3-epimerase